MSRRRVLEIHQSGEVIAFRTPYSDTKTSVALIVSIPGGVEYALEGLDVEELYDLVKYVLEGQRPRAEILCGFQWQAPGGHFECCLSAGHVAPFGPGRDVLHIASDGATFADEPPF